MSWRTLTLGGSETANLWSTLLSLDTTNSVPSWTMMQSGMAIDVVDLDRGGFAHHAGARLGIMAGGSMNLLAQCLGRQRVVGGDGRSALEQAATRTARETIQRRIVP